AAVRDPLVESGLAGERLRDLDPLLEQVRSHDGTAEAVGQEAPGTSKPAADVEDLVAGLRRAVFSGHAHEHLEHRERPEVLAVEAARVQVARARMLGVDAL